MTDGAADQLPAASHKDGQLTTTQLDAATGDSPRKCDLMTTNMSGEFFNPLISEHVLDPDDRMFASRIGCPVAQVSDVLYTANTDEIVREIFTDTTHFSNRGNFSIGAEDQPLPVPVITLADPPTHTALRARLMKNFSPAKLRRLTPQIDTIVRNALEGLPDSGTAELYEEYVHHIPAAALYALIGIPKRDWRNVQRWSDLVVERLPEPVDDLAEFALLTDYLTALVEQRRAHPGDCKDDVLDNLCFAERGEADMPTLEVVVHLSQLVSAATDTTRSLITNCIYRLLEHRDQWESLLADRSLLPNAIEESLRLDSPAQFMVRSVVAEVTVGSHQISPGKKVYLNIQSANHDEVRWGHDSRTFRADRPNAAAHLAFGRGIHACIGAPLARIEAQTAIAALLDTYPNMTLAPEAKWVKCAGVLNRRVRSVPVLLTGQRMSDED